MLKYVITKGNLRKRFFAGYLENKDEVWTEDIKRAILLDIYRSTLNEVYLTSDKFPNKLITLEKDESLEPVIIEYGIVDIKLIAE